MHRALVVVTLLSACHVTSQLEITRPGKRETVEHRDRPESQHPSISLTDDGHLRFVQALSCPSEDVTEMTQTLETHREPNMATFVVGVVATSIGAILLVSTGLGKDPTSSPLFYTGALGVAVGVPFAVGPWLGRTVELAPGDKLPPVRTPGPTVPCGERGMVAPSATVTLNETDVRGTIDKDGVFSVSPYELVDAFGADADVRAWNVTALLDAGNGATTQINRVFDGSALAGHAARWLAAQVGFDRSIEQIKIVPAIVPGTLRVSLTSTATGPAIRVVLPLKNDGPGEAWAVRGQIASTVRAIDSRMLYVGKLKVGEAVSREIIIPIASDVASMLRGAQVLVSVQLQDAHGTAPTTPVRFNGQVLIDLPRSK